MSNLTDLNSLGLASTDFNEILSDFINYLKSQSEFTDYNFSGSNLSQLMNLLTYAILYVNIYSNQAIIESNIRTAKKRENVVQAAQSDYGYVPDSISCATTQIEVSAVNPLLPSSITFKKGDIFTATVSNTESYKFSIWDDTTLAISTDGQNLYSGRLDLVQGTITDQSYTYNEDSPIIIYDTEMDRKHCRVYVDSDEWTNYTYDNITKIDADSTVFYLRETSDGYTEIYFGTGVLNSSYDENGGVQYNYIAGLTPTTGQSIKVEYLKSDGSDANGAIDFAWASAIDNVTVTNIIENPDNDSDYTGASGGADIESMERIRKIAPLYHQAQNRAVTGNDYKGLLQKRFGSYIQAIDAFTKEGKYNYVFIAIKPTSGLSLTTPQKDDMLDFLKTLNVSVVDPVFVEPDYLYINHHITVSYNAKTYTETNDYLINEIITQITDYYTNEVEDFNDSFHVSKLLPYIDSADNAIEGSKCNIGLIKERTDFYSSPTKGVMFDNELEDGVTSSDVIFTSPNDPNVNYPVSLFGFDKYVYLGPFADGDLPNGVTKHSSSSIGTTPSDNNDSWIQIGTYNTLQGSVVYDFSNSGLSENYFDTDKIIIYVTPISDDIYVENESLCVYDNNLRPDYTQINLKTVS